MKKKKFENNIMSKEEYRKLKMAKKLARKKKK
jgi:hypothetical protein